jgi:hypothetical protein
MVKTQIWVMRMMTRNVRALTVAGLIVAAAACDNRPKVWTAWVYADAISLANSNTLTGFSSFEQCQVAAISMLRSFPNPDAGAYECGYMCRWDRDWQTHVCKETRK